MQRSLNQQIVIIWSVSSQFPTNVPRRKARKRSLVTHAVFFISRHHPSSIVILFSLFAWLHLAVYCCDFHRTSNPYQHLVIYPLSFFCLIALSDSNDFFTSFLHSNDELFWTICLEKSANHLRPPTHDFLVKHALFFDLIILTINSSTWNTHILVAAAILAPWTS